MNIKKILILFFVCCGFLTHSQSIKPYFSAIIVENMVVSKAWYIEKLGLTILNEMSSESRGFKQANLMFEDGLLIELLEIDAASNNEKKDSKASRYTKGLFKIGFLVKDFDQMVENLQASDVEFHGNVVKDDELNKRMVIIKDPDGNRIQLFEDQ